MTGNTVAVVGASVDRSKFGNKAVRAFRDAGWTVFPIHPSLKEVEGITAYPDLDSIPANELDQVSFYVPPHVGIRVLDQAARKRPREVWLNPGSESAEILERADAPRPASDPGVQHRGRRPASRGLLIGVPCGPDVATACDQPTSSARCSHRPGNRGCAFSFLLATTPFFCKNRHNS